MENNGIFLDLEGGKRGAGTTVNGLKSPEVGVDAAGSGEGVAGSTGKNQRGGKGRG